MAQSIVQGQYRNFPQPPSMPTIVMCDLPGNKPDRPLTCVLSIPCSLSRAEVEVFLASASYACWKAIPIADRIYGDLCIPRNAVLVRVPAHHKDQFMVLYNEYFRGGVSSAVSAIASA